MKNRNYRELKGVAESARLALAPTLATNALVAWVWTAGQIPEGNEWTGWCMIVLMGLCFYLYGMWENDRLDARWDARHGLDRPVPRGDVSVWTLRWLSMVAGTLGLILSGAVGGNVLLGLLLIAVIIFYNWMHKQWSKVALVLMGGSRGVWAFLACVAALVQISGMSFDALIGEKLLMYNILWYPASLALYTMICTWVAQGETESPTRKKFAVALLSGMCLHDAVWLACLQAWSACGMAFGVYGLVLLLRLLKQKVS